LLEFVHYAHPTRLGNYSGNNVDYILRLLYSDDDDDDDDEVLWTSEDNSSVSSVSAASDGTHLLLDDEQHSTHNLAHGLHFASIAMLGLLVLEVSRHLSVTSVNSFIELFSVFSNMESAEFERAANISRGSNSGMLVHILLGLQE